MAKNLFPPGVSRMTDIADAIREVAAQKRNNHNHDDENSSPRFTRRHYIWLASVMRDIITQNNEYLSNKTAAVKFVEQFSDALASENPQFDKQKFLDNVFVKIES